MNILIVGGGKVGTSLANMLGAQGHNVTIIEVNDAVFNKLQRITLHAQRVSGDGCKPQVLLQAGVESADAVVAVTGDDEDNLVVAKLAKHEYNAGRVIARVNNPKNEWLFTPRMGVDIAISHSALLARIIHEELSMGDLVPLLKLQRGQISLSEVTVPPESLAVGQRVDALQLPSECVLATLLRNDHVVLPRGDTIIEPGDKIIALVKTEQQAELVRLFG
jgi:trk system potassium uptake protein TrkA